MVVTSLFSFFLGQNDSERKNAPVEVGLGIQFILIHTFTSMVHR